MVRKDEKGESYTEQIFKNESREAMRGAEAVRMEDQLSKRLKRIVFRRKLVKKSSMGAGGKAKSGRCSAI